MKSLVYFDLLTMLPFVLIWFGIVIFLRVKRKKSLLYILLFSLFYVYIFKVLDYTLFQFQTLLLLQHFMPGLMLNGQSAGTEINLIPLITLTLTDVKTSLLNILLLLPFGFGLPFITKYRMKETIILGAGFSIVIELVQLITGVLAHMTFRVADINDVLFNTAGAAIGYVLFVGTIRIYRRYIPESRRLRINPVVRYLTKRPN